jgi:hypothetical protein
MSVEQNRGPRNICKHYGKLIFLQRHQGHNGKRIISCVNGIGKTG